MTTTPIPSDDAAPRGDSAPEAPTPDSAPPSPRPADWKARFYRPPAVREAERRDSGRRALRLLEGRAHGGATQGAGRAAPPRATGGTGAGAPRTAGGWLTVQQVARRLALGHKYVYSLIYQRELNATNFGKRQWRVHEEDVAEFIARRVARRDHDLGLDAGDAPPRPRRGTSPAAADRPGRP